MKITRTYIPILLTISILLIYGITTNIYSQKRNSGESLSENLNPKINIPDSVLIKDSSYYFLQAVKYFNEKDLKEAKINFLKTLEMNPNNDASYYYLAQIALDDNDFIAGEAYIKEAIARDSTNFWYRFMLGNLFVYTKREGEAIKTFEELIKKHPKRTDIYYNLANLYMNTQDLDKANATLDRIIQIAGKSEAIGMAKFEIFRAKSDWEGALKYLIEFDKDLNSSRIENLIGDLYSDRYKDSLALVYYEKSIKNNYNNPGALLGQAEVYRNRNEYDMFFKKSIPLFANPEVNSIMKDQYLKQLMQFPQMILAYRAQMDTLVNSYIASSPNDTLANYAAAIYYARVGETDKCISLIKSNMELLPNDRKIAIDYLSYIYSTEDWALLAQESEKIEKTFPNEVFPVQLYAISKIRLNEFEKSIKALERQRDLALKIKDTTALLTAYSLLGDAYHQINNPSKTYQNYKKALAINPQELSVLNNYAYYLSQDKKQLKKAYEMSAVTVEKEPDNPTYLDTFGWILFLMDRPVEAKAHFKHAMLYGGKESAVVLDHYAEVLYKLKEYDLAFIYWDQAKNMKDGEDIAKKIKLRKEQMNK